MSLAVARLITIATLLLGLGLDSLAAQQEPWLSVDSATQTLTLTLQVQAGANGGPATIAGHHHGNAQIVVPLGWTVRWHWVNGDSAAAHSLVVMAEREKIPAEGGRPVFDNAMSRSVTSTCSPDSGRSMGNSPSSSS